MIWSSWLYSETSPWFWNAPRESAKPAHPADIHELPRKSALGTLKYRECLSVATRLFWIICYCPPSICKGCSTDTSGRSLQQATNHLQPHFFFFKWTRKIKGGKHRLHSCPTARCAMQNTSASASTGLACATEVFSDRISPFSSMQQPGWSLEVQNTSGCSHFQRGGGTPEEFGAAHSAPECRHLVKPMLGPVRAHWLRLLKCSSLGLWVDMLEHHDKNEVPALPGLMRAIPLSHFPLHQRRKDCMWKEGEQWGSMQARPGGPQAPSSRLERTLLI